MRPRSAIDAVNCCMPAQGGGGIVGAIIMLPEDIPDGGYAMPEESRDAADQIGC